MVSEGAPAAELLWPCGLLEGSRGTAPVARIGRWGRRLLRALLAGVRTVPRDPGSSCSSGNRRLHFQHLPVLDDGAPGSLAARALPGSYVRRVRSAPSARSPIPDPRSAAHETLGGGALCGLAGGPNGGAGAGCDLALREMPSGVRCRLYLRSCLTSAARVPRARAAPGDLARPLRPHSLTPPRNTGRGRSSRRPLPTEPQASFGAVKRRCQGIVLLWEAGQPYHAGLSTPRDTNPGRDRVDIQTRQTQTQTQAPCPDARSHHPDLHTHAQAQKHTRPSSDTPPRGEEKSPDLGPDTPTGTLPPSRHLAKWTHTARNPTRSARTPRTGTRAVDGMGGGAERE